MSASTDFQGFKKKNEFIISYNATWDIYEVNYDKILPFEIPDTACHVPKGLSSVYYFLANKNDCVQFDLYDKDIAFHYLMPHAYQESGSRVENGEQIHTMFGPKSIKHSVEKLLALVESRPNFSFHDWEKDSLEQILKSIDVLIEEDGIVSIIYG